MCASKTLTIFEKVKNLCLNLFKKALHVESVIYFFKIAAN